ncbi:MAG: hypothetical protein HY703_02220 [Gemmatimonadetes bacterium]|nr:hypothetical protein [Gemmatimonadota bacterium]
MKLLWWYAAVGGAVVALAAVLLVGAGVEAPARVWALAGAAWLVQLGAFGALLLLRRRGRGFFLAWGGGTVLRLGVVLGVGLWLARTAPTSAAPLLLSFAGFLFLLLLLEPVFLRSGVPDR